MHKSLMNGVRLAHLRTTVEYRRLRRSPSLLVIHAIVFLVLAPAIIGRIPGPWSGLTWTSPGAYVYGTRLAISDPTVLRTARGVSGLLFLVVAYLVAFEVLSTGGFIGSDRTVLSGLSIRCIVIADLLTLGGFVLRSVGPLVLLGSATVGLGSGSVQVTITALVSSLLVVVSAVSLTYALVLAVGVVLRERVSDRRYITLTAMLTVALFGFIVFLRSSLATLGAAPVGWYADFALFPWFETASLSSAGAIPVVTVLSPVVGVVVGERAASQLWTSDSYATTVSNRGRTSEAIRRVLDRRTSREVSTVVVTSWVRLHRNPHRYLYGGLLLVLAGAAGLSAARRIPSVSPVVVSIYGAAAVAVGPTLNPLGVEGRAHGGTFSTFRGARTWLTGLVFSIAVPGAVLVGVAATGTALWLAMSLRTVALSALIGSVLGFVSPFVSVGIGLRFPNYGSNGPTRGSGTDVPRFESVALLTAVIIVLGLPAVAGFVTVAGEPHFGRALRGAVVTLIAGVTAGGVGFRYGVRRVQRRTPFEELEDAYGER